MARTRHPNAAELDREVAGREGEVYRDGRSGRRTDRSFYYAYRHDLWGDGGNSGGEASRGRETPELG